MQKYKWKILFLFPTDLAFIIIPPWLSRYLPSRKTTVNTASTKVRWKKTLNQRGSLPGLVKNALRIETPLLHVIWGNKIERRRSIFFFWIERGIERERERRKLMKH